MRARTFIIRFILNIVPLVIVLIIWEFISVFLIRNSLFLPSPSEVFISFLHLAIEGTLLINIIHSFFKVAAGFLAGSFLGLVLGIFISRIKILEIFFKPIINLLQPIPKIAWIPLAILWFGLGFWASFFIISLAAFWPVLFTTWNGVKNINKVFVKVAESLGAGRSYIYFHVLLPASLPYAISGMRLGIGMAWRAVVAAELLTASTVGLGYMIFHAREFFRTDEVIVGMILIGAIGIFIENVIFRTIEKKTIEKWGYGSI